MLLSFLFRSVQVAVHYQMGAGGLAVDHGAGCSGACATQCLLNPIGEAGGRVCQATRRDRVRLCFEERVAALRVVAGRWRDTQLGAQRVVRLLRRGAGVRTQFLLGVSQLPVIVSQTP